MVSDAIERDDVVASVVPNLHQAINENVHLDSATSVDIQANLLEVKRLNVEIVCQAKLLRAGQMVNL
jgi:hypothetical protein